VPAYRVLLLCHLQLLQQVQRLRATLAAAPNGSKAGSPPAATAAMSPTATAAAGGGSAATAQAGFLAPESSMDIEAMACELLALGFLVQVRDGAQQQERTKTTRSCLQNLRHRFVVCLGWRSSAEAEPEYLAEPLVVEPRFREQFAIAHPTPAYEELLQVRTEAATLAYAVASMYVGIAATAVLHAALVIHVHAYCSFLALTGADQKDASVCAAEFVWCSQVAGWALLIKSRHHSGCMVLTVARR
jgi:hypothetical protein